MAVRFTTGLPAAAGLVLPCCSRCGRVNYPPRELCGACLADSLVWQGVDNIGMVQACTDLHYSLEPDYADHLPWRIASVVLACGPVVLAHLQPGVPEGTEVAVRIVEDRDGNRMLAASDPHQAGAAAEWLARIQFKECSS
ncbi:MAG: zinc ribbon domain-containing protein [Halioglobus sp.]